MTSSCGAISAPQAAEDHAISPCLTYRGKLRQSKPFPLEERTNSTRNTPARSRYDSGRDGRQRKQLVDKAWRQFEAAWPSERRIFAPRTMRQKLRHVRGAALPQLPV